VFWTLSIAVDISCHSISETGHLFFRRKRWREGSYSGGFVWSR